MSAFTLKRIDELPSILHGAVKLAGDDLGVAAFGLQVLDLPPGFADYPEHDHAEDGQEEVYLVVDGSAEFTVDGETMDAGSGSLLRVAPGARRNVMPGAKGVRIVAIGGVPGAYERPDGFRVQS